MERKTRQYQARPWSMRKQSIRLLMHRHLQWRLTQEKMKTMTICCGMHSNWFKHKLLHLFEPYTAKLNACPRMYLLTPSFSLDSFLLFK